MAWAGRSGLHLLRRCAPSRLVADGYQRIERQCRLVSAMECNGRDGLPTARGLLDRITESYEWYRKRTLTRIPAV